MWCRKHGDAVMVFLTLSGDGETSTPVSIPLRVGIHPTTKIELCNLIARQCKLLQPQFKWKVQTLSVNGLAVAHGCLWWTAHENDTVAAHVIKRPLDCTTMRKPCKDSAVIMTCKGSIGDKAALGASTTLRDCFSSNECREKETKAGDNNHSTHTIASPPPYLIYTIE